MLMQKEISKPVEAPKPKVKPQTIMIEKGNNNPRVVLVLSANMRGNTFNGKHIGNMDKEFLFVPKLWGERRYYPVENFDEYVLTGDKVED